MRKILYLLLALLLLTGCKGKKLNKTEHREEQRSERKEVKDSSTRVEKAQKVSTFDIQQSKSYEITLESDKDSMGNAKEVVYYRIRDGDSETIRVINGRVTLKTIDTHSKSLQQADSTLTITTNTKEQSILKTQTARREVQKDKEVKVNSYTWIFFCVLFIIVLFFLSRKAP
ncbi:lipoprotein [uncultured Capnocytophaga sp.]|uniref:lipoprotein n=1 Tax=uncultured Capnocytophaga sp. TaxID=159273 RepID=UPI002619CC4B|nr:lipoprotein [uncultured Capnocytophaga sp.]